MNTRLERDTLGALAVPAERLWGAQTQRALLHFNISHETMPREVLLALAVIKATAAQVNTELGLLPPEQAAAIARAAEEVANGEHWDEFPLPVWQSGSGTPSHMNMNEVLANRASELLGGKRGAGRKVHPNDAVNLGQSSNDVFPSAIHVAASVAIAHRLLPAVAALRASLDEKARAFADLVKIGRTHLQDATPVTLGQEFSGYAAQLLYAEGLLGAVLPGLYELALGGTAVGTGLNSHPEFALRVAARLNSRIGLPFRGAGNKFAALAGHEPLVAAHGALKTLACALTKIANDIRWLASGPRCGLGEIRLPENEPGSSIMPGKVNPTQCEAVLMVGMQVLANDVAVNLAGASGQFELNVAKPLLAHAVLQSVRLLADACLSFEQYCVRGIEANRARLAELLESSLMLVTALTPHIGYDRAAEIARHAEREGCSLRQAGIALGHVSDEDFERWVQPKHMVGPTPGQV